MAVLVAAANLGLPNGASAATYYRWVDAAGNTVISDRPPGDTREYETISTGAGLIQPEQASDDAPDTEVQPAEKQWRQPEEPEQRVSIEKDPEKCQRAREIIQTLGSFARIRVPDENGEYRYIGEEEKDERRKQAEQAVDRYCEQ